MTLLNSTLIGMYMFFAWWLVIHQLRNLFGIVVIGGDYKVK